MPPKYMSGAQKRKKKERQDALSQGQAGAIAIGPSGLALLPLIANGKWWVYLLGLLGA